MYNYVENVAGLSLSNNVIFQPGKWATDTFWDKFKYVMRSFNNVYEKISKLARDLLKDRRDKVDIDVDISI